MPTISVIVPVYNVEDYLDRCILSIINQNLRSIEIILINDGSTDNSGEICNKYSQNDIRIKVIHKENEGLSVARNLGIELANGEYIAFVDSDDFINENMFDDMVNIAYKNNSDIVVCKYRCFEKNEDLEGISIYNRIIHNYSNQEALEDYFSEKYEQDKNFHTIVCNKIYRRKLFDNIKFPPGKLFEDGYVTYKLLYESRLLTSVNAIYYFYYKRNGSIMNSKFNEKELYSYDDWREIFHYIYKYSNNLSSLVAKRYVDKHIYTFYTIKKYKEMLGEIGNVYKMKIRVDLKKDYKLIINLKIGLRYKVKLMRFLVLRF